MSDRYKPIVDVVTSPNEVLHEYSIAEHDGTFTKTPHIEFWGTDISALLDKNALPMDETTRDLYRAVKALSTKIVSVSIEPQKLTVEGPRAFDGDYYYTDWPEGLYLDHNVVRCIAKHFGWDEAPIMRTRRKSPREAEKEYCDSGREAVRLGGPAPEDWDYSAIWQ